MDAVLLFFSIFVDVILLFNMFMDAILQVLPQFLKQKEILL